MAATKELTPYRWFNTLLWGNTVSLSWMWGLGLFFSVQFTSRGGKMGARNLSESFSPAGRGRSV
jgi:hypothetical protein